MSYLVLHIDVEFIVGAVYADNGTSYPITHGKEELLWLYFHNNPHQDSISYGQDNKVHFNNSELNYYGKFFEKIEKETETFTLRGIEYPVIGLIKESGLLKTIRKAYRQKTLDNTDQIPTLITFSTSIHDNAKQKTVDYLKKSGFQIESYTIPVAELTCYHALNRKGLKVANGSVAILIEATNTTLHLMKMLFSDNYFLKDGKIISHRGKGLDPRKRALVRFVVNEVNKTTGVLSSEDEKEDEIERLESAADDWLKRLDAQPGNRPFMIRSVSFAKALNMKRDVLVRKDDLDSDTGQFAQDLKDIFDAFRSEIHGDVAAVFLLGDCFQSERVKRGFEQMIGHDRLLFYANKDIRNILTMYPKIDINRYASEEARIKERAKAEENRQAEQRAMEAAQRKAEEAEHQRQAEAQKKEQNRKEAQQWFEKAVELEKALKLDDAKVNVENALALDKTNREYKQFYTDLVDKIKNLKEKNELYKSYLSKGDKFLENNELKKAIEEYEAAQSVFDNAEINSKIIEVKRLIKNTEQKKAAISQLLSEVQLLISQEHLTEAQEKANEVLTIDKENAKAKSFLTKIEKVLQQQEKERQEQEIKEKRIKILAVADKFFDEDKWTEAQQQYEMALKLCPQDNHIRVKNRQCADKIKERESALNDLLSEAKIAETKGKLQEALSLMEQALQINPDSEVVKKRIKTIKTRIKFEDFDKVTPDISIKVKDGLGSTKNDVSPQKMQDDDNDFLGTSKKQKSITETIESKEDSILNNPKKKKTVDAVTKNTAEDDFLRISNKKKTVGVSKNKENDFDSW